MAKFDNTIKSCPTMIKMQQILTGKWKILILWYIQVYGVRRFGQLLRQLESITQSTLTKQLRELENDGLISRHVYQEVPPKVEYQLTDLGKELIPILDQLYEFSAKNFMKV